jgi:hypothetical protein
VFSRQSQSSATFLEENYFDLTAQSASDISLNKEMLIGAVVRYDWWLMGGWLLGTTTKKGLIHRYQAVTREILREMGVVDWQSAITTPQEWLEALSSGQISSDESVVKNHLSRLAKLADNIDTKNPQYEHFQSLQRLDAFLFRLSNIRADYKYALLNACTKPSFSEEPQAPAPRIPATSFSSIKPTETTSLPQRPAFTLIPAVPIVAPKPAIPSSAAVAPKPRSPYVESAPHVASYPAGGGYSTSKLPAKPAIVVEPKPASVYVQPARPSEKARATTLYYSGDYYSGNYASYPLARDDDDYVYYASAPVKQTTSVAKQPAPVLPLRHSSTQTHQRSSLSFHLSSTTDAFANLSFDEAPRPAKTVATTTTKKAIPAAETESLPVTKIHFSQTSVSDSFAEGNLLSDLVTQLVNGEIHVDEIPPIRVVKYNSKWYTLDNRRLRVFKNALVDNVPVIICDFNDSAIKKEFYSKNSNKSLDGGGVIRASSTYSSAAPSRDHFDSGIFVFNKRVLSWTFEQIAVKLPGLAKKGAIPKRFASREDYYASFEELIFEEARAILQAGLDEAALQEGSPYKFRLENRKLPKKADGITALTLSFLPQSERESKPGEVMLLEYANNTRSLRHSRLRLIALRSGKESAEEHLSFKAVINEEFLESYPHAFEEGARWNAKLLGSLITHQRMYEACTTLPLPNNPETILEQSLWMDPSQPKTAPAYNPRTYARKLGVRNAAYAGYLDEDGEMLSYSAYSFGKSSSSKSSVSSYASLSAQEKILLQKLNPSQRSAVEQFLPLSEGIQLIQGPPGTGKTSTIVHLLKILSERGERVLVSAPSNKAVQVVAEKFIAEYPDVPVAYAGVEEKLSDDIALRQVFIHTWGATMCDRLTEIGEDILNLRPEKLVSSGLQELPNKIPTVREELLELSGKFILLINEMVRYKLTLLPEPEREKQAFQSNIHAYVDFIVRQPSGAWKEIENYLDILAAQKKSKNKKGSEKSEIRVPDLPYLATFARRPLSAITSLIDSLKRAITLLEMNETKTGLEGQLLDNSSIVFATLSVLGRRAFKEMDSVDSLIVDEAGQCVEAETLIALVTHPRKCLLIGDIKQLPATVISQHAVELNFDRSLMERLVNRQQKYPMLEIQYRMNPAISAWPSQRYYDGSLLDDPSTKNRVLPELRGAPPFLAPYAFIHVDGEEEKSASGYSFINEAEAEQIEKLLQHLKEKYKIDVSERVGVITFYRGQADYLQEKLSKKFPGIRVNTVDGFQGGENDFIIMSFVRANPVGKIGFLKDMRRLNVALTRAKFSLIMVGDAYTLQSHHHDVALLIADAYKRRCFFQQSEVMAELTPKVKIIEIAATRAPIASPPATSSRAAATLSLEAESSSSSLAQKQAPKRNSCRFFNGEPDSCRRGNKCKFEHAENKSQVSTTKMPALVEQIPVAIPVPEVAAAKAPAAKPRAPRRARTPTSRPASSHSAETNTRKSQGQRRTRQAQEPSAELLGKSLAKSALAPTALPERVPVKAQAVVEVTRPKPN